MLRPGDLVEIVSLVRTSGLKVLAPTIDLS